MSKKHNAIAALTAAALPLTGHTEVAPEDSIIGYRYTQYQEDDAPSSRVLPGTSTERYTIDVHQFHYATPLGEDWYINNEFQYETLSGASPVQTIENDAGQSVLVMSGATIDETRYDLKSNATRYFEHGTASGNFAYSTENDYTSFAFGGGGTLELFDKHTTLIAQLSTSFDELSPTDASQFGGARQEADGRKKRSTSIYQGVSQVLNKFSVLQVGIGYTHLSGYLSDPYKANDVRPGERDQFTVSAQYRRYFQLWSGAAWHSDYRYYSDDWGIQSHTLETKWAQKFSTESFAYTIIPLVRYYRQTSADFYSVSNLIPEDDFVSSDSRLSTYGALTIGLEQRFSWEKWTVSLDYQNYSSSEDLALFQKSDTETPALVNFTTLSLGIQYRY